MRNIYIYTIYRTNIDIKYDNNKSEERYFRCRNKIIFETKRNKKKKKKKKEVAWRREISTTYSLYFIYFHLIDSTSRKYRGGKINNISFPLLFFFFLFLPFLESTQLRRKRYTLEK